MRLLVRHGINGKEELAIQVAGTAPVGWDIMKQLAWRLDLESPFQIILYLNSTAAILSPVRAISSHMTSTDLEICYLVQNLQVPTAEHYQSLVTALYEKDVVELCHLLGQGLDLTWLTPDGGIPAPCSHLQSFEIMTLMHMRIRLPEICGSPGLGSA